MAKSKQSKPPVLVITGASARFGWVAPLFTLFLKRGHKLAWLAGLEGANQEA